MSHKTKWIYFFLRETIRNSIDAYCAQQTGRDFELKITLSADSDTRKVFLKVKDIGFGFPELANGQYLNSTPHRSLKDKAICLGGSGFGLNICQDKLDGIYFKNRKSGGAAVKTSLGSIEELGIKVNEHAYPKIITI